LRRAGNFDQHYSYAFDYDYWLRCSQISLPGRIRKPLAVFRIHELSKGNTGYEKQFSEDLIVVKKYTQNKIILLIHHAADELVKRLYGFFK
jgi:hypothetical protein